MKLMLMTVSAIMSPAGIHIQGHGLHDREVRGLLEHRAPARSRQLHAESEKGEPRLHEDGIGHVERRADDDGAEGVGQEVRKDDRPVADAETPVRLYELPLAEVEELAARYARRTCPGEEADGQHRVPQARPEDRDEGNHDDEVGEAHHGIGEAHDDHVGRAAQVAREAPEHDADRRRDEHRYQAHGE